ncbi:MAG: metalloregulator ArsR/SmtB family transcription factor [Planctomycetota bacterium]
MTPTFQSPSPTPRHAIRRRARLDGLLDPTWLRALAEPNRASLLSCLLKCRRPCSVTEVADCCALDFSMVARHLQTMARAGLLTAAKQGRTVWYSADGPGLSRHLRALADAIDELGPGDGCCDAGACAPKRRSRS